MRVFGPAAPCGWSGHLVCSCTRPSAPDPGRTYANPDSEVPKSTPTNSSGEGADGAGAAEVATLRREEEEEAEEAGARGGRKATDGRAALQVCDTDDDVLCVVPKELSLAAVIAAGPTALAENPRPEPCANCLARNILHAYSMFAIPVTMEAYTALVLYVGYSPVTIGMGIHWVATHGSLPQLL